MKQSHSLSRLAGPDS